MSDSNIKNINFYKLITAGLAGGGSLLTYIITTLTGQAPTQEEAQIINSAGEALTQLIFSPMGLVLGLVAVLAYFGLMLGEKTKNSASPEQQKRIDNAVATANKAIGMANQYKKENNILAEKMRAMEFQQKVNEEVEKRLAATN